MQLGVTQYSCSCWGVELADKLKPHKEAREQRSRRTQEAKKRLGREPKDSNKRRAKLQLSDFQRLVVKSRKEGMMLSLCPSGRRYELHVQSHMQFKNRIKGSTVKSNPSQEDRPS